MCTRRTLTIVQLVHKNSRCAHTFFADCLTIRNRAWRTIWVKESREWPLRIFDARQAQRAYQGVRVQDSPPGLLPGAVRLCYVAAGASSLPKLCV